MRGKKLTLHIILAAAVSIFTIELIIGVFSVVKRKDTLILQTQQKFQSLTNILKPDIEALMKSKDYEDFRHRLQMIEKEYGLQAVVLFHPSNQKIISSQESPPELLPQDLEKANKQLPATDKYENLYRFAFPVTIDDRFTVLFYCSTEIINKEVTKYTLNLIGLVLLIIVFVTVTTSIAMMFVVGKPIIELQENLETAVGKDKLDLSKKFDLHRKDEIGEIAETINRYTNEIQQTVIHVSEDSKMILDLAENLHQLSAKIGNGNSMVLVFSRKISKGAKQQSDQIHIIEESMQNMQNNIDVLQDLSAQSLVKVESSVEVSNTGSQISQQTIESMQKLNDSIQNTAQFMENLGGRAQKIDKIISVISKIAGQINLLSLNAAIEAERAGELGKGFAVVASEVSKLADESMRATREITNFMREIQSSVENTSSSMKQAITDNAENFQLLQKTVSAFHENIDSLGDIKAYTSEVANKIRSQKESGKEILKGMEIINKYSTEYAEITANASSNAEEQKQHVSDIEKNIEDLNDVSKSMNDLVDKFIV
ncbi:MAG: HAMP domain-containing methyl-accepting chemotaxis protein [Spirochaetota bacterium]